MDEFKLQWVKPKGKVQNLYVWNGSCDPHDCAAAHAMMKRSAAASFPWEEGLMMMDEGFPASAGWLFHLPGNEKILKSWNEWEILRNGSELFQVLRFGKRFLRVY